MIGLFVGVSVSFLNNEEGECKSIYNCQPLLALVNKNMTIQDTDFLKKSQCGFREKAPAVCCPKKLELTPESNKIDCEAALTAYPPDPRTECCGINSRGHNKLIGTPEAEIDQFPWLVMIEYVNQKLNRTRLLCSGTLISNKYVLTAAHCVVGRVLNFGTPQKVRLGEYDISNEGSDCMSYFRGFFVCTDGVTRIDIEKTIPHPEFKASFPQISNDIALIRLKETAPFTDFIRPICLPTKDVSLPQNTPGNWTVNVAGWGSVDMDKPPYSNVTLYEDLSLIAQDNCQAAYVLAGRNITLAKGQLCTAREKTRKDSCRVDSGGPLMYEEEEVNNVIIGVFSLGTVSCDKSDIPDVYTNVYDYVDWIKSTIVP